MIGIFELFLILVAQILCRVLSSEVSKLLPFELLIRFYSDYLAGDVYFKTNYEAHNLNRARVQMKLCESIEARESMIRRILERV